MNYENSLSEVHFKKFTSFKEHQTFVEKCQPTENFLKQSCWLLFQSCLTLPWFLDVTNQEPEVQKPAGEGKKKKQLCKICPEYFLPIA